MSKINERKSKKKVLFTTPDNVPLSDTTIKYELKNHKFLFGCTVPQKT